MNTFNSMNDFDNEYDFCINIGEELIINDGNYLFNGITGEKIDYNENNEIKNINEDIQINENNTNLHENQKKYFFFSQHLDTYFSYFSYFSFSKCYYCIVQKCYNIYKNILYIIGKIKKNQNE